jgi:RTX calcium-binding nonapeptide repeat (4 copies)
LHRSRLLAAVFSTVTLVLPGGMVLAPAAPAESVGSDLDALTPTQAISCPRSEACVLAQALGGNGTPFSPPTGVITSWSVKLGAKVPEGIRLVVQRAAAFGGAGGSRRVIDVGRLRRTLTPNGVTTFPERLPIHADETFGVRLEARNRARTAATISAPFTGEYNTLLLWDPPMPFGGRGAETTKVFGKSRITINAEVAPPSRRRCSPLNTYTGSSRGDDYGGFLYGGDVIYGYGGNDHLRAYRGEDCVYGGRGNDQIAGMDGSDLLVGGPGRDDIGAGQGNDRILVRDGRRDVVRCGGGDDLVKADGLDVLQGCERVRRG